MNNQNYQYVLNIIQSIQFVKVKIIIFLLFFRCHHGIEAMLNPIVSKSIVFAYNKMVR